MWVTLALVCQQAQARSVSRSEVSTCTEFLGVIQVFGLIISLTVHRTLYWSANGDCRRKGVTGRNMASRAALDLTGPAFRKLAESARCRLSRPPPAVTSPIRRSSTASVNWLGNCPACPQRTTHLTSWSLARLYWPASEHSSEPAGREFVSLVFLVNVSVFAGICDQESAPSQS